MRHAMLRAAPGWRTWLLLAISVAAASVLPLSQAEPVRASHGSVRFKPSVVSLGEAGRSRTVIIEANGVEMLVGQAQFHLLLDTSLFKVDGAACVGVAADHGVVWVTSPPQNPVGVVTILCQISSAAAQRQRRFEGDIITFRLTSLASFAEDKTIRMEPPRLENTETGAGVSPDAGNFLTAKPRLGVNLLGKASLQHTGNAGGMVSISLSCPSLTDSVTPGSNGAWLIPSVPPETCTLKAVARGYLAAEREIDVGNQDVTVPDVVLLWGDADGDGAVTIHDISRTAENFGKAGPQPW